MVGYMKICRVCQTEKFPEEFPLKRKQCLVCYRKKQRVLFAKYYEKETVREERKQYLKRWSEKNPIKLEQKKQRRRELLANAGGGTFNWDRNDYWEVTEYFDGRCGYCSAPCWGYDHIIPISKGGSNAASNIINSCLKCNSSKKDRFLFVDWFPKSPHPKLTQYLKEVAYAVIPDSSISSLLCYSPETTNEHRACA
jgi:5-methylcytosine-specific restriction endonuclease McrA